MMKQITRHLAEAGKPVETLTAPDGMRLVVLPYGGRILGLYAPGSDANFLWTHPGLASADSARALYAGTGWPNSGGVRSWLAPEIDFFLPAYPETTPYVVPPAVDPGSYAVTRASQSVRMENRGVLRSFRSGQEQAFLLAKEVTFTGNPLPALLAEYPTAMYAGYRLFTTLECTGTPASKTPIGLWHLLQLPHGGDMIIATREATTPMAYFDPLPNEAVTVTERAVRYRMDAKGVYKLGVKAAACTGRVGYRYDIGGASTLVVCDFTVDPHGRYIDPPWQDLCDLGYAVQACNVSDAVLGNFSELEYHVPAIGGETGRTRCEDDSRVWAYQGPDAFIDQAMALLLGLDAEFRGSPNNSV